MWLGGGTFPHSVFGHTIDLDVTIFELYDSIYIHSAVSIAAIDFKTQNLTRDCY